jgi:hypothetical protein
MFLENAEALSKLKILLLNRANLTLIIKMLLENCKN